MWGAVSGDIIGSVYEHRPVKTKDFALFSSGSRFTDDSVLTMAIADSLVNGRSYRESVLEWGRQFPFAGYGGSFIEWLKSENPQPYNSWGNGSAMRVSPVGLFFNSEAEVLAEAEKSAIITHDHSEGVKGAHAVALAIFLARKGYSKEKIRQSLSEKFNYDLNRTVEEIRPDYEFDVSCQGSVPEAIIAFLDSCSFEDAIRNAISLGGDSDTQACIAGAIAEAFYGEVSADILP